MTTQVYRMNGNNAPPAISDIQISTTQLTRPINCRYSMLSPMKDIKIHTVDPSRERSDLGAECLDERSTVRDLHVRFDTHCSFPHTPRDIGGLG
jgi:hypothetical protein